MDNSEADALRRQLAANYPSLRDSFALAALGSLIEIEDCPIDELVHAYIASQAYSIADAMMKARDSGKRH
jgi:hypothetical protein